MDLGVDLDQTAADLGQEMTWDFHEVPCHIFYRVNLILSTNFLWFIRKSK